MNRLFIRTLGPTDWGRLLADADGQWRRYKSALEMAICWEAARNDPRGLPPEVANALDSATELRGAELLLGLPEHKVALAGGGHASQNDLWALLRANHGLVSMTIEAKAGEKLDNVVADWLPKDGQRSRKRERLTDLEQRLALLAEDDLGPIRYQLLHRTASALKEADRFGAAYAVMVVQSFNRQADESSWQDFMRFAELMGATAQEGAVCRCTRPTAVPLYLGWVSSLPADALRIEAAL